MKEILLVVLVLLQTGLILPVFPAQPTDEQMEGRLSNYCTDSRFKRRRYANYCKKVWLKNEKAYCTYAADKPRYKLAFGELCGDVKVAGAVKPSSSGQEKKAPPAAAGDADREMWNMVKNSNDIALIEMYLDEFPQGKYRGPARVLLYKLRKKAGSKTTAAQSPQKVSPPTADNPALQPSSPSDMVLIEAGEFMMGSEDGDSDEKPVHRVYLDAYYIDKHEVTVADYRNCVNARRCKTPKTGSYYNWGKSDRERHPINGVDWPNAKAYCEYAGKRLPTEAEWEKAATWKNGTKYKYPSGKDTVSCADAVMDDGGYGCGKYRTWEVGSKPEEINGTYDMAGNVWEWVEDWYEKSYYQSSSRNNPKGPNSGSRRVFRGGSWLSNASILRGATRYHNVPSHRRYGIGVRCARSPVE